MHVTARLLTTREVASGEKIALTSVGRKQHAVHRTKKESLRTLAGHTDRVRALAGLQGSVGERVRRYKVDCGLARCCRREAIHTIFTAPVVWRLSLMKSDRFYHTAP